MILAILGIVGAGIVMEELKESKKQREENKRREIEEIQKKNKDLLKKADELLEEFEEIMREREKNNNIRASLYLIYFVSLSNCAISQKKQSIIDKDIKEILSFDLEEELVEEIKNISKLKVVSFECVKKYLDEIPLEDLKYYDDSINKIIEIDEVKTYDEMQAKATWDEYYSNRKKDVTIESENSV